MTDEFDEGTEETPGGAASVADAQWQRVRALASTVSRLEAQGVEDGLDEDGEARLARARIRAARAAERALLADEIADRLAELKPAAGRGAPQTAADR